MSRIGNSGWARFAPLAVALFVASAGWAATPVGYDPTTGKFVPATDGSQLLNPVLVVTANTTLTANDRTVIANNTAANITITLPSAPPDGTPVTITRGNNGSPLREIQISRGGTDTIIDGALQAFYLGGAGSSARLMYSSSLARWLVTNLQKKDIRLRWDTASSNDYLQFPIVSLLGGTTTYIGGPLATAQGIHTISGVTVLGCLVLQARTGVGATTTVKVRSTGNNFAAAVDVPTPLSASISTSGQGQSSCISYAGFSASVALSFNNSVLVLQATTAISTPLDIVLTVGVLL